ncbi:flagellin [Aureimonas ureilytica]|uniref:flagellin N-terminal helical domain-containing protein n=1 Tax=Aureimonas ureilytica TaxID=401562 RepID=UPI000733F87D|nr:flagellin [Aureimonas ureilytica]
MTSVNTNAAALTALRTLQNTNAQLETTQSRISTGYKIGEAKDNAAYWSISTTLKSDNKSLSTVKDALGLGASTVDTAYQGLTKAKDVLDEIKSKLTAATQDGVNRDTIQQEIGQLQDQLKSIASSSVFSGENWLSVDSSATTYNANKQVVASFSRDANGSVSIGTIKVDTSAVSLFDASTATGAGGIVNGAVSLKGTDGRDIDLGIATVGGNTSKAGLASAVGTSTGLAAGTAMASTVTGAVAGAGLDATGAASGAQDVATLAMNGSLKLAVGQKVSLSYVLAGTAYTTTYTVANAVSGSSSAGALATELANMTGTGLTIAVNGGTATSLDIKATANNQELTITDFRVIGDNTAISSTFTGQSKAASMTTAALNTTLYTGSSSGLTSSDKVQLTLNVDGSTVTTGQLAIGSGAAALATALNADANFSAKAFATVASNQLTITSLTTGTTSTTSLTSAAFYDATSGAAKMPTTAAGTGLSNVAVQSTATTGTFAAINLDSDDNLYFNIQVDGAASATNITINKALIDKTLTAAGHVSGQIATATEFKTVMDAALAASGVTSVKTSLTNSNTQLVFTTNSFGATSSLTIGSVVASTGADKISVDKIDISATGLGKVGATTSDQIKQVLTAYISVINTAINKVTSAAAGLGSVASRIDMQKSFVNTLMDTIDKGVGNLIDADMTEESTKLQALQVKQQLGTQALSIANQSAQGVLSLFRS